MKIPKDKSTTCCIKFKDSEEVSWRDADEKFGPCSTGWVIISKLNTWSGMTDFYYINIKYCPFCGVPVL